ncbi:MAG: nucleotidyltransferase domain-containing protein [Chloroflexota bacterium]|nr:nucleotidyltransferase domain-containing protein [Chloroflexota bacterium]
MIALIAENRKEIAELCEQYGVRRLSVFGSAAKGTFDPVTSDLDFVVDYFDWGPGIFHRLFGFIVALEDLLGRRVDMTTEPIKDPYFREEVERTKDVIYEASRRETAA